MRGGGVLLRGVGKLGLGGGWEKGYCGSGRWKRGGGFFTAIATSFRLDLGFDTDSLIFLFSHFETARLHPSDSDDRVPTVNSQSFIKQKKKAVEKYLKLLQTPLNISKKEGNHSLSLVLAGDTGAISR